MRKKQGEQPIIRLGADKKAAPDPDFFQLNWKEVRNLLEENARLQVRSSELNQEYVELQERVASLGRLEISELAEDIRGGGEEKESKELHKARAEFEKVKKLSEACLLALDRNRADIHRQILKHREKWTEEINGKLEERLGAVESALSELKATQTDLYALAAVKDWLGQPTKNFGYHPGPNELHTFSGGVNVGDMFAALLEDARDAVHRRPSLASQGYMLRPREVLS